jgi:hypothetical protein
MAHLVNNLGGLEIAFESQASGQAELAPEGASDLAGYAQGASWRVGNEHRLDEIAVMKAKQVLARSVGRFIDPGNCKGVKGRAKFKLSAKSAAKVRALTPGRDIACIKIFEELACPKGFFSKRGHPGFKLLQSEILYE